jgi:hypothetical protein
MNSADIRRIRNSNLQNRPDQPSKFVILYAMEHDFYKLCYIYSILTLSASMEFTTKECRVSRAEPEKVEIHPQIPGRTGCLANLGCDHR